MTGVNFTLKLESVFNPLDIPGGIKEHGIETAGWNVRQGSEVMLSSKNKAFLFMGIDAGCRTAETAIAALAHFCKHQRFSIVQDQVDLAEATVEIGLNQFQAVSLQKLRGDLFGPGAGFHCRVLLSTGTP
jgi:hypothetical protein